MKQKTINKKIFLFLVALLAIVEMKAQAYKCGNSTVTASANTSTIAGCTGASTTYTSKYQLQQTYIPTTSDPLIVLKVTLHMFTNDNGTVNSYNQWPHPSITPSVIANINYVLGPSLGNATLTAGYNDRYSVPRVATFTPTLATFTGTVDSRIRYEITNIYFYKSTATYTNTSNFAGYFSYINSIDPTRLDEGLPIIYTDSSVVAQQVSYGGYPAIFTSAIRADPQFMQEHIAHEIGHCFGLGHTYANTSGGGEDWQFNNASCGYIDYLDDVFPSGMTLCPTGSPPTNTCTSCYELAGTADTSNNLMSGQKHNLWMSPKQMGRRYRNMHLNTYNNGRDIRHYARDMTSDHVNAWSINSNETWDFDIQMYNDIIVKAGHTLTIKCKVAMAIDGKIKVEKGANLIVDGGEITGWCKTGMWTGVELDGSSSQNQNFSGGYSLYQGYINIINSGTLSNADIAIKTGTTDASGTFDWGSTGGVIVAHTANFINNRIDVQYNYYHNPLGGNAGSFTKCNFKTTAALVNNVVPYARVTLYEVEGVHFSGNNFEYSAGSTYAINNRGYGITSADASYIIDQICNNATNPCTGGYTKNQFKNYTHGVYAYNTNPLRVVSISNTNFYDCYQYSTYLNTINTPIFTDNYVRTLGSNGAGVGLYLDNCKYYNIKNNTFLENSSGTANTDVGIYVKNSQSGAHKIYRNSFANFMIGVGPINDNSGLSNTTDGLKMNCNDFTPTANAFDIAVVNTGTITPTVMKDQGSPTSANTLVRNRYAAASTCTNCENKWYIVGTSGKIVNHPSNSDANTKPTPQPANSDYSVNVISSAFALNYTLHCQATETTSGGGGSGGGGRLANINNKVDGLTLLKADNARGNNPAPGISFDLQATVAEKLNYFLLDTLLASKDSVIALLKNNPGAMEDADVQLTYAYINKGDLIHAQQNANALLNTKPDWSALQTQLINLQQSPQKAFSLKTNTAVKNILQNYAATEEISGRGAAQAILKWVDGQDYFIPHPLPYMEGGINKSINNPLFDNVGNTEFSVYPNPANTLVNVVYISNSETMAHIIVTNALGKKVYETDQKPGTKNEISLDNFTSGVYLLMAYNGKAIVYQTKVICIK